MGRLARKENGGGPGAENETGKFPDRGKAKTKNKKFLNFVKKPGRVKRQVER